MKLQLLKKVAVLALIGFTLLACETKKECYSEKLYQEHKNDMCTMDCPGYLGCDGKEYCNECSAKANGITKRK